MDSSGSAKGTKMKLNDAAKEAYLRGDYEQAMELWRPLAEAGDTEAQAWIGSLYANGEGVATDSAVAFYWYLEAAERGSLQAQANVGALYFMGQGVEKNLDEAVRWLSAAADGGDIYAIFNLATLYAKGEGVPENLERAAKYYRIAAERGHYPSQSRLGFMYAQGRGLSKDRVQAYLWLTLAAQHGIGSALTALESVIGDMSAEEKAEGMSLFDAWRGKTQAVSGQGALYPQPA